MSSNIWDFFVPRQPLEYIEPEEIRHHAEYSGYSTIVDHIKSKNITVEEAPSNPTNQEKRLERRTRKYETEAARIAFARAQWTEDREKLLSNMSTDNNISSHDSNNTTNDANLRLKNITEDPIHTLFVGRLPYSWTEENLHAEFSIFGEIAKIILVRDHENKSRGYGFVQYVNEDSFRRAYKEADGHELEGRHIVVDIERGRIQHNWLPRRLGGGLGTTRAGPRAICDNTPGRYNPNAPRHGGDRGKHDTRGRPFDRGDQHRKHDANRGNRNRDRDQGYNRGDRDRPAFRDRGDRFRGDRDRNDRDRSDFRDRERGDRDRGDRDRYRDWDRDKDKNRDRDRGGERDRNDRGDREHRRRDSDWDRDRDRERSRRESRSRSRERRI